MTQGNTPVPKKIQEVANHEAQASKDMTSIA